MVPLALGGPRDLAIQEIRHGPLNQGAQPHPNKVEQRVMISIKLVSSHTDSMLTLYVRVYAVNRTAPLDGATDPSL